jgi:lysophospholipase L1-like esterase
MIDVLVFGGSITFGDYDKRGGWVHKLGISLMVKTPEGKHRIARVFNLSVSGETSKGILTRLVPESRARLRKGRQILYIFHVGLNDSIIKNGKPKISEVSFEKNIKRIIKASKYYSDKIIFLSPPPVDEAKVSPMPWSLVEYYYLDRILQYSNIIKESCKTAKAEYIDLFKLLPVKKYVALLTDGVHPNSKGHEMIYRIVKDFLEEKKYI